MNPKPITIVLFGRTGVGKSSLANQMSGQNIFSVGMSLISETDSVASEVFTWPLDSNIKVKIVDTPGFADNRQNMTNGVLLSKILDFLKNLQDGLHIAIFCLSAKTRIDQHDTQELEMLGLLLGGGFFDHVCLAVTQANTLIQEHRQKVCKNFVNDLPGIFLQHGLPPFTQDRILFADFDNLGKSFMEPMTNFIRNTKTYVPELSEEINTEDPESIQRFLAKPEMKEVMKYYEKLMAAQKKEIEGIQHTIAQHAQETQNLMMGHLQEQENLQKNLEMVRQELKSSKIQNKNHRKQLEDFAKQEEIKLQALNQQMNKMTLQNDQMQKMMEKKDSDISALNSRIVELQNVRHQPPQIIIRESGGGGGCNIF